MISIITAVTENNIIGKDNKLPWHLPKDWKHFAAITKGHAVIMGRPTYESIFGMLKKPLPERTNIVITRNENFKAPGCIVVHSLSEALEHAKTNEESFIIGGAQVYAAALPFTDKIYLTRIHATIEGDAFFPKLNEEEWKATQSEFIPKDEKNEYDMTFFIYERVVPLTTEM